MDQKSGKLPLMTLISFGAATFAMHFGGSCMLWPVTWGQQSGSSVLSAMVGIILTALLLPWAAYLAMVKGEGSFWDMAARINKKFGFIFGGLTIAVLGPLFVIPRMSSAAWDAITRVFEINEPSLIIVIAFQVIYYVVAYWFLFQQTKILDKVGQYLTPILVITVIAVVAKSLTSPMSAWVPKFYPESGLQYGLINGYQTMDLPGSLVFGSIIILNLKAKGLQGKSLMKYLLIVTGIGFAMLSTSHLTQMLVGASTGDIYKEVSYARLYATIILDLWGKVGGGIFNVALLLAALTSAVGLSAGCAEFFAEATEGKWAYKPTAIVILIISTAIASFNLSTIITLSVPILFLIYPPCIALVAGYIIFGKKNLGTIGGATYVAFAWGILDCVMGYLGMAGVDLSGFMTIYNLVPLATYGVGWFFPTIIGGIIGYYKFDKGNSETPIATS